MPSVSANQHSVILPAVISPIIVNCLLEKILTRTVEATLKRAQILGAPIRPDLHSHRATVCCTEWISIRPTCLPRPVVRAEVWVVITRKAILWTSNWEKNKLTFQLNTEAGHGGKYTLRLKLVLQSLLQDLELCNFPSYQGKRNGNND